MLSIFKPKTWFCVKGWEKTGDLSPADVIITVLDCCITLQITQFEYIIIYNKTPFIEFNDTFT